MGSIRYGDIRYGEDRKSEACSAERNEGEVSCACRVELLGVGPLMRRRRGESRHMVRMYGKDLR